MIKIKKLNADQLYHLHRNVIDELLLKIQKEYDDELYSTKSPSDKLTCQICGGKYTRSSKAKHFNSNLHTHSVQTIHSTISDAIYK